MVGQEGAAGIRDGLGWMHRLLEHDRWANAELLALLERAPAASPRALRLLAHVLATERLWLDRLRRRPPSLAVWPELDVAGCRRLAEELDAEWAAYLGARTPAALTETVAYTNSKGEPWTSAAGDVVFHVIGHGQYHRGQVNAELRAAGIEPPYLDYVHAVRTGQL